MPESPARLESFNRRRFLKVTGGGAVGGGTVLAGSYYYGTRVEPQRLRVERVTIPIRNLHDRLDGLRIAFLSDFHLYPTTQIGLIEDAVRESNRLSPDLVLLGGDFVQATAEAIFDLAPTLARLESRLGIFSILGNHDHWKGAAVVAQGLESEQIVLLRNRNVTLNVDGQPLFLAGVDDGWVRRNDLSAAMDGHRGEVPAIVLMHEPDFADEYARDKRITLQLSGHSHGGQVRFPLVGSPFCPPYGRKYDMGLYKVEDMWLYTNVGIGVTAPIRLNCPPEVTEIVLRQA